MRELSFKEVEKVSGGWIFLSPIVKKIIAVTLVGVMGTRAIDGDGDGPRGPTPAGPRRR